MRHLAERVAIDFARAAATFEHEYIFCWLDWDGDNCLTNGGILDYGSVRQFGLFHREYRFDDGPRWSTSIVEQRNKARYIVQTFAQARAMYPFLNDFDGIVVSGEIKALKSGPEIHRTLLQRYDLAAGDCLFIDDVQENVDGAIAVGMHAVQFRNAETLRSDLQDHGLL